MKTCVMAHEICDECNGCGRFPEPVKKRGRPRTNFLIPEQKREIERMRTTEWRAKYPEKYEEQKARSSNARRKKKEIKRLTQKFPHMLPKRSLEHEILNFLNNVSNLVAIMTVDERVEMGQEARGLCDRLREYIALSIRRNNG
jgi:hypothetical protein